MCTVIYNNLIQKFVIFVSVFLLKLNCFQQNRNYAGGTYVNLLRFHDFEPRAFHFHYSNTTFKPMNVDLTKSKYLNKFGFKNQTREKELWDADREGRGFHFHSTDEDMTVEVEFIIPFMSIPIEGGMQLTKSTVRNLLNLKTGSLLWAGAIVAIGTLVAGTVNTIGALKPAFLPFRRDFRRKHDFDIVNYIKSTTNRERDIGDLLSEKLMKHNIDLKACMQKSICHYVQRASEDVRASTASNTQKILDGLVNVHIWPKYFSGTSVQIAIEAGRNSNCDMWTQNCKLTTFKDKELISIMLKFLNDKWYAI